MANIFESFYSEGIYFFYKIRKNLPKNLFFYCLNYIIKYIGVFLFCDQAKKYKSNVITLQTKLVHITLFGKSNMNALKKSYMLIMIIITLLLVLYIVVFNVLYFLKNKYQKLKKKKSFFPALYRKLIKIMSYILTFFVFLSQHIIEYSFLGIFNFFQDNSILKLASGYEYLVFFLGIINILLLLFYSIFFAILSSTWLYQTDNKNHNLLFTTKLNVFPFLSIFQGIFTILNNLNKEKETMYVTIAILSILVIQIWAWGFNYNFYSTNYSLLVRLFLTYCCIFFSIFQISLYYSNIINITQANYFGIFLFTVISSFLIMKLHVKLMLSCHFKKFKAKLFDEKKVVEPSEFFYYMELLEQYQTQKIGLNVISQIFSQNQLEQKENNNWKKIDLSYWSEELMNLNLKNIDRQVHNGDPEQISKSYFLDYLIIGESEIIKSIYFYYKNKKTKTLEALILLHIEYLAYFKNEINLALYMDYQYISSHIWNKYSFRTKIYLFEIRKKLYQSLLRVESVSQKHKLIGGNHIEIDASDSVKKKKVLTQVFDFAENVDRILEILSDCCLTCVKVCEYKANLHSKSNNSKFYQNCDNFISLCEKINKDNRLLIHLINKLPNKIRHYETNFLLYYYYRLIFGEIPKKICDKFVIPFEETDFIVFNFTNPLLVYLSENDEFLIKHVSKVVYTTLGYKYMDLQNKNINCFIPVKLDEFHRLILKKFALFSNASFTKTTFILDKKKFMHKIKFSANSMPSLENNFGIIFDIVFVNDTQTEIIEYNFILDKNYKILCATENFSEEFFFTLEMVNTLKLNFCSFFNIPPEKLSPDSNMKSYKLRGLLQENEIATAFIQWKNEYFSYRKNLKSFELGSTLRKTGSFILEKSDVAKNVDNLNKVIDELGFDIEWYSRAKCFKDRVQLKYSSHFNVMYNYYPIDLFSYYIINISEKIESVSHILSMTGFRDSIRKSSSFNVRKTAQYTKGNFFDSFDKFDYQVNLRQELMKEEKSKKDLKKKGVDFSITDEVVPTSNQKDLSQVSRISGQTSAVLLNKNNSSILSMQNSFSQISTQPPSLQEKYYAKNNEEGFKTYDVSQLSKWTNFRYLIYIYYTSCVAILFLSSFFYIFNKSNIKLFKGLFDINAYSILIKADIYFNSLFLINYCTVVESGQSFPNLDEYQERIEFRRKELMKHHLYFFQILNNFSYKSEINQLYSILTETKDYYYVTSNFVPQVKQSSLKEEIGLIHYYFTVFEKKDLSNQCRFLEVYYENKNSMDKYTPNTIEKIMLYIVKNILTTFKEELEKITIRTNEIIDEYGNECIKKTFIYNGFVIAVGVIIGAVFYLFSFFYLRDLKLLLIILYEKEAFNKDIEDELIKIKETIADFSKENCDKIKLLDEKSTRSLILKRSIKKKKTSRGQKEVSFNKYTGKDKMKNEIREGKESQVITLVKDNQLLPSFVISTLLFSVILTVTFFTFEFVIIIIMNIDFNNYVYINMITINFLNRIPLTGEILLYIKISSLFNDPYFIYVPQDEYLEKTHFNYYNYNEDLNSNSYFENLKGSMLGLLYYQSIINQQNIKIFRNKKKNFNIFSNLNHIEEKFEEENGVCIYGSLEYEETNSELQDFIEIMKTVNEVLVECKTIGEGLSSLKLTELVEYIIKRLIWVYCDLISAPPEDRDIKEFNWKPAITNSMDMIIGPLNKAYNTIVKYSLMDMENIYKRGVDLSFVFALVSTLVVFIIILHNHFFSMDKLRNKVGILNFIHLISQNKINETKKSQGLIIDNNENWNGYI